MASTVDGHREGPARRKDRVHGALLLLSLGSGAADAFAFLALSGTFTANMTGNLVLAGMFTRPDFPAALVCAVVAILAFVAVVFVGFRLVGAHPRRGSAAMLRRLLLPSLALQCVAAAIWAIAAHPAPLAVQGVVIALSAGALGLQTVAAKTLSDVEGVTTTYVTGTITATMQALAQRRGGGQALRVLSILSLPAGAVAGAALVASVPIAAPLLPAALALTAILLLESSVL